MVEHQLAQEAAQAATETAAETTTAPEAVAIPAGTIS